MFFVYEFFTWFVLIALLGATFTGLIVGSTMMAWIDEETDKAKRKRLEHPIS